MGAKLKHLNDYRAEELLRALDNSPIDGEFEFDIEEEEPYYETANPEEIEALIEFETAEDIYTKKEYKKVIGDLLDSLTPREAKTLRLRFGIDRLDEMDMTLEEVSKLLYVTRERVRQIEAKALRKMRHPSRADRLKMCMWGDSYIPNFWEVINTPPPWFDPDFDNPRTHKEKMEKWYNDVKLAKARLEAVKEFIKSGKSNYKGEVDDWLEL